MKQLGSFLLLLTIIGYLGSYGGKLCIYNEERSKPLWILPYSVTSFPQTDQAMLEQGIPYRSKEEFCKLIENYLS